MAAPENDWAGMVKMCEDHGLLAKRLYVIFTTPTDGLGPVMENLDEHLKFQGELESKGIMLAAGPFSDDAENLWEGEGMVIIRASSKAEAEEIANSDPMHKSGARSFQVRPWLMNEGKMTIEVTFSDGSRKII